MSYAYLKTRVKSSDFVISASKNSTSELTKYTVGMLGIGWRKYVKLCHSSISTNFIENKRQPHYKTLD